MRSRTRMLAVAVGVSTALLAGACSSSDSAAPVTVTSNVTVAPTNAAPSEDANGRPVQSSSASGGSATSGSADGAGSSTAGSSSGTGTSGTSTAPSSATGPTTATSSSAGPAGTGSFDHPKDGVALPDGFVPTKLKAGEKPPQFIVVSFDGVGWDEKWQYWFDMAKKVPFRFTGFLSGTYMLTEATKDHYQGPGHQPGASDINWNLPADLPVEINDLNHSLDIGNEVGTHFNGHFCGAGGGDSWTAADWNTELDQFFALIKNYKANNPTQQLPTLKVTKNDIRGERTPCLEGHIEDLFPALAQHNMIYDSSFTRRGISWPTQSPTNKIWQIGMAEYPMHGTITGNTDLDPSQRTQHVQITMDYNFYYSQEKAGVDGLPSKEQSQKDMDQVVATYNDMYNDTFNGNRAPLILGNHFNQWNNNAYSDAIGKFVQETCGKADTECVPFRDLIAWMEVQDPARLAQLQAQAPELGKTTGGS
ncbi:polysaccharide deacetylase family protein [Nakamurella lactea]|uniref:polysaccharide deacetylase n=1 Tax=Nakamurella lactea TaxID=459515 RepID=UPI0004191E42|nr:polysaccharide deacetylase [Nakamurella lactea]